MVTQSTPSVKELAKQFFTQRQENNEPQQVTTRMYRCIHSGGKVDGQFSEI